MEPAPLYTDVAAPPDGGAAFWLKARDGVRIRIGVWSGGQRGTVMMFPGRSEYVEKYLHIAAAMRARGYATVIVDWRGQGLADRALADRMSGHVGDFDEYQLDVAAVLAAISRLGLPDPLFLIAHSMGGCIGLRALMHGLQARAAAFSGPMWGIKLKPHLRPVAWTLGTASRWFKFSHRYAPSTREKSYVLVSPFEDNLLTSDRSMYELMQRQGTAHPELSLGGPTLGWLIAALRECRALKARPSPNLPTLVAVGGNERIIDIDAVTERMARWPGARLVRYPGAEHEIIMERPEILNAFLSSAADLFDKAGRTG